MESRMPHENEEVVNLGETQRLSPVANYTACVSAAEREGGTLAVQAANEKLWFPKKGDQFGRALEQAAKRGGTPSIVCVKRKR